MESKLTEIADKKQEQLQKEINAIVKKFNLENEFEIDEIRLVDAKPTNANKKCSWVKKKYKRHGKTYYKFVWICK